MAKVHKKAEVNISDIKVGDRISFMEVLGESVPPRYVMEVNFID